MRSSKKCHPILQSWTTVLMATISLSLLLNVNSLQDGDGESRGPRRRYSYESREIDSVDRFPNARRPHSTFPRPVFRDPKETRKGWPWNLEEIGQGRRDPEVATPTIPLDNKGRVKMGVNSKDCDDGKTKLEMDWDGSPVNYTCFHPETPYPGNRRLPPIRNCVTLPKEYLPKHFCMKDHIYYDDPIPSYGDHRPVWPKFGEYSFVPVQRWLHSIEHGAVVMLYHPCTHPIEVTRLKRILRNCNGKHVISASSALTPERPLALLSWGCKYFMSVVDEPGVIRFIAETSFNGPEGNYTKEGQYDFGLLRLANETVGARYDRITCDIPNESTT